MPLLYHVSFYWYSFLLLKTGGSGDAGAIFTIVALLIAVVPFFFIPSILRASMTAMGNLGMRIAQFGRGIGGGITRGIRNSEIGRDVQRRANMHYFDRAAHKLEKRAKRLGGVDKLSDRQRLRLGRYNASYNRLGFEELRAGGIDTRIKPGSTLYDSMTENVRNEQFDKEVTGKQNLIKNGNFGSIIDTSKKVSGEDDAALSAELDEYLKHIINPTAYHDTDEKVEEYVKNAQAIINTLSDRGTSGARTKVMNSISQAMSSNAAALTGASGEELKRLTRTFGSLASRISSKYGKLYKGDNPGSAAMLGDIAKGDFRHAGTFRIATDYALDGHQTGTHLRSTEYSKKGLDGINEEDFSKLKTSGLSNILAGIQDGDISGSELQEVARLSNEVLNSDIYKPDGDARKYMEWIRDAAFASSAGAGTGRTAGSGIISSADSRALNSIFDQVQGAKDWGSLTAEQQQHFGQLMSNINESLTHDAFEASDAAQLKQTLKIAHSKGFQDSTGQVVQEFTGSPTLKIPRNGAGSTRQKISLPSGWAQMPDGRWIEMTSSGTRNLTPAEIRKAEQIETHNNQVDIDNGTI